MFDASTRRPAGQCVEVVKVMARGRPKLILYARHLSVRRGAHTGDRRLRLNRSNLIAFTSAEGDAMTPESRNFCYILPRAAHVHVVA